MDGTVEITLVVPKPPEGYKPPEWKKPENGDIYLLNSSGTWHNVVGRYSDKSRAICCSKLPLEEALSK